MSLLTRIRCGHAKWGRPSLVLITFAWLNVLMQPCAMAMTGGAARCAHTPIGHSDLGELHEHADHGAVVVDSHAVSRDGQHGGQHEAHRQLMESGCVDCGGGLTDCAHLEDINKSDRGQQLAPDTRITWIALPMQLAQRADTERIAPFGARDAERLSGAFPPLNVLYCVYLD